MGHSDSARRKGPNQPPAPDLAIPSQQIASMEGILKLELGKKIWEGRTSKGGKKGRGGSGWCATGRDTRRTPLNLETNRFPVRVLLAGRAAEGQWGRCMSCDVGSQLDIGGSWVA